MAKKLVYPTIIFFESVIQKPVQIQKLKKLKACLNGKDLDDYTLNSNGIFADLEEREKGRIAKAFGGAAKYRRKVIETAELFAQDMEISSASVFMFMIEIVAAKVKDMNDVDTNLKLAELHGAGRQSFFKYIVDDLILEETHEHF